MRPVPKKPSCWKDCEPFHFPVEGRKGQGTVQAWASRGAEGRLASPGGRAWPCSHRLLNPPSPPLCSGSYSCGHEPARPCLGMSPPWGLPGLRQMCLCGPQQPVPHPDQT